MCFFFFFFFLFLAVESVYIEASFSDWWLGGVGRSGQQAVVMAAKKKCKERELLKLAYWKINRPK